MFTTGDYLGLTEAQYIALSDYTGFPGTFTAVSAGNGILYIYSGDEYDFIDWAIDADCSIELGWYSYVLSTDSWSGI